VFFSFNILGSLRYLLSDKNISIIAMLYFDVIVRQVMVLSLERIIWYDFNGFVRVEIFVEEPFFPAKKLLDEHWEEVHLLRTWWAGGTCAIVSVFWLRREIVFGLGNLCE
jgi:hypothetical protein